MMDIQDKRLDEYAALLVRTGVNIQKGQTLILSCPVDSAYFARKCAAAAYEAGCREVVMRWRDDALARMRFLSASEDVFDTLPAWEKAFYTDYAREGAAYLAISAGDPQNLLGVDPGRIRRATQARGKGLSEFYEAQMGNRIPWCIGALPIPAWAEKVFPDLSGEAAMDALWEKIFAAVRITGRGDAVEEWKAHLARLNERITKLNDYRFVSLHYKNALGTDFTVGLPEGHLWQGGADHTPAGVPFVANIPTEEIFTAPDRESGNGVLCASLPFVCNGHVVRGLRFAVKAGKIIAVHADEGEEIVRDAIAVDEGASYFGELALVPYDSPISNQKILYYHTLFDENAACHVAFGKAYPCLIGGENMSTEEQKAHGLNDSITHEDFMIGTPDLSIDGYTHDGRVIPVFRDGNFAL